MRSKQTDGLAAFDVDTFLTEGVDDTDTSREAGKTDQDEGDVPKSPTVGKDGSALNATNTAREAGKTKQDEDDVERHPDLQGTGQPAERVSEGIECDCCEDCPSCDCPDCEGMSMDEQDENCTCTCDKDDCEECDNSACVGCDDCECSCKPELTEADEDDEDDSDDDSDDEELEESSDDDEDDEDEELEESSDDDDSDDDEDEDDEELEEAARGHRRVVRESGDGHPEQMSDEEYKARYGHARSNKPKHHEVMRDFHASKHLDHAMRYGDAKDAGDKEGMAHHAKMRDLHGDKYEHHKAKVHAARQSGLLAQARKSKTKDVDAKKKKANDLVAMARRDAANKKKKAGVSEGRGLNEQGYLVYMNQVMLGDVLGVNGSDVTGKVTDIDFENEKVQLDGGTYYPVGDLHYSYGPTGSQGKLSQVESKVRRRLKKVLESGRSIRDTLLS